MRMVDKKILESFSERSYQFHEKTVDFGDTLKERTLENRLRNVENRLDKVDFTTSAINSHRLEQEPVSFRKKDQKLDYLEEKLIEATELSVRTEKRCLDLEHAVDKQIVQLRSAINDANTHTQNLRRPNDSYNEF